MLLVPSRHRQIWMPPWGSARSHPRFWRFSIRKYSPLLVGFVNL